MNVGIIGCGTIGRALAKGLQSNVHISRIAITTKGGRFARADLPDVIALDSNEELARSSDIVVLCVKPFQVETVARGIASELRSDSLLVSVAASVSTDTLHDWISRRCPIMRAMPNTPCRIGAGMTALTVGPGASDQQLELTRELFEAFGRVVIVEEAQMDAVTALSGCGPAYVYLIIEALTDAGVSLGLPRPTALQLTAQTLLGASELVLQSGAHPAALKDEVTTPAGCTIDALLALEQGRLRATLANAVAVAARRSATLGTQERSAF